ncbi:DUF3139 domain-containing protein (plasmid) [Parageobacillus toebii NBRC 107807]|uniref:Uncharacterized protein n=1 Tax=Parageobacillus toebii NBRC 107807 TaxID=1223503 RepID=A0A6G9J8G7_9BACL|nr:DUF3139 domain-containing protein [Parageobacillus toebii]MBB3870078.1 hypothetical protein [Parageobacillus toebii NBRC 107807]QIQ34499.1 DUF3139 domain-containing protein [Parageobacillus toebii NBRC 107807]QSB50583.1 DUF3139 domain-containing protein [Parageobacillus toebii]
MVKKIGVILLLLFIVFGSGFGYIQYKKTDVKNSVIEYLTTKKNISKDDIISIEPFFSNLKGNKAWMVSIKLKNDNRTYFYYKNDKGKVILESYTENGIEHIINKEH